MKIDTSKLKNVVKKTDGEIVAQCPACSSTGHDAKGEHLIVYPDGRFACVKNLKDKEHYKEILKLVGFVTPRTVGARNVTVRSFKAPPSKAVMIVPRRSLQDLRLKRGEELGTEVKR